ncbi:MULTISPECIES: DUF937 domain-containing protein [unclassified Leptolyngbya]|uniref:DUF937 domain-containing protein n=1 Tax=unclassified Leptolyngbya TaxID=2650499 RepID=UPI001684A652|nr:MULTISPECIES: DUF937 domain-containing protein [unclassified Leptolyngbya]MBD1910062.1 DUF937 domain-containing protein [Leptolyngbya sp. FACHB-8]MBD2158735.1 DUF937 domain-containing protein [Leptolyngbya sp. FACHB-16]
MAMFFDVLSAINNPNLQGNVAQLETVVNTVQQFAADHHIPPSTMQTILSALGGLVQANIRHGGLGSGQLGNLLGQTLGGGGAAGVQALFPPPIQQQFAQEVGQRTGLDTGVIQAGLPLLLPAVLKLLNMGNPKSEAGGANPLLTMFLDGDRDGDTDLGEVFRLATHYINPEKV